MDYYGPLKCIDSRFKIHFNTLHDSSYVAIKFKSKFD